MTPLTLELLGGEYAVCRLPPREAIPAWAQEVAFASITRSADELSIVCPATQVPAGVRKDADWRLLKVHGPFEFSVVGVMAAIVNPLAQAGVSVLAIATFDTDYVLVKTSRLATAKEALTRAGHTVS